MQCSLPSEGVDLPYLAKKAHSYLFYNWKYIYVIDVAWVFLIKTTYYVTRSIHLRALVGTRFCSVMN